MNAAAPAPLQTLTYGDFLALPSVPGVLWRITDRRDLKNAGEQFETRAELEPYRPGPDAQNPAEGAERWGYDEPLRIGRAERVGVSIELRMDRDYDRKTDTYGARYLRAVPVTRNYSQGLTDPQRELLRVEAGNEWAFSYVLPPLSAEEIRERIAGQIADDYAASNAARETIKRAPNMYQIARADQENDPAAYIREAFEGDEGAEALRLMLDDATELYRAALRKELLTFGAVEKDGPL